MENLTPDQVRAWSDAVGPTALIFLVIVAMVLAFAVVILRREKAEAKDRPAHVLPEEIIKWIARTDERVSILWDEWKGRQ